MIQKAISWLTLIYGALLMALAAYGYYMTMSQVSLIMGLAFGGVMTLCALAMFSHNKTGLYVAVCLALALTIVFSIRYSSTNKMLPGIMAVFSGAVLLVLSSQIGNWKK